MPMDSASSAASRRPAVSISSIGMPPMDTRSVTRSRVVPGMAVTMARSRSTSRLKSDDLPTLGRPTMANASPECTICPCSNDRPSACIHAVENFNIWSDIYIVLGKINACFQNGDQLHQLLLDGANTARKGAIQLLCRYAGLVQRL